MAENRELALVLKLVADQFQSELKRSGGIVGEFQKLIGDWRTQLTLGATALFAIAKSTATFGEEALKTSQRIGLTVEQTTALQYAANLADVPVQTLERGLQTLAQRAVEAARGSGEGAKLFASLGVSATDAAGKVKPLDQLFFEFQDRLKGVGNQAEFVEAGVSAFGKGFRDLAPMLRQGSDATKAMMEEGRKLGAVMTGEQAQAASRFNDELKRLDAQLNGMKLSIGNALIPTMRELIELFRTIGVGTGLGSGLQLIQHQLIMLNTLLKELQAGSQFLFGTGKDALSFDQLKQRLSQIEAGGRTQLFELRHPGVLSSETGGSGGTGGPLPGGGGALRAPSGTDQEKLGKAKLEIFLAQNRALEIQARLRGEADNADIQQAMGAWIVKNTQATVAGLEQEQLGRQIVQQTQAQMAIDLARQTKEMAEQEQLGRQIVQQTQAQLAIEETRLAASRTFFDEWADGMRRYVADTKSGFGLGADLARRTAQTMEQGFRTFFFDLMDGKIKTFKDAMRGLLDFVKQIIAQITAQLVTQQILKYAVAGLSAIGSAGSSSGVIANDALTAAAGGQVVRRFASGGPVLGAGNMDTVPALLTPGEFVLSRADVQEIRRGAAGGTVNIGITVNAGGGGGRESGASTTSNFTQLARDLSKLVELKIIEEQRPGGLLAGA